MSSMLRRLGVRNLNWSVDLLVMRWSPLSMRLGSPVSWKELSVKKGPLWQWKQSAPRVWVRGLFSVKKSFSPRCSCSVRVVLPFMDWSNLEFSDVSVRRWASSARVIFSVVIWFVPAGVVNAFLKSGCRSLILPGSRAKSWCISEGSVMGKRTCCLRVFARPSQKNLVFHARFWRGMEFRRLVAWLTPRDLALGSERAWLYWWQEAQEMVLSLESRVSWKRILPRVTRSVVSGLSCGRSGIGM